MKINNENIDVDNLIKKVSTDFHKMYNGIPLTDEEYNILNKNGFNVGKYANINELIYDLDNYLDEDSDNTELEYVLSEISEFNYYHNTKK